MPDATGRIPPVAIPRVPWHEKPAAPEEKPCASDDASERPEERSSDER